MKKMSLKEKINKYTDFKTHKEIVFGSRIVVENKDIYPIYEIKIRSFKNIVPEASINPIGLFFKEKNQKKYEYYIQFINKTYMEYKGEISKAYYEEFKENISF